MQLEPKVRRTKPDPAHSTQREVIRTHGLERRANALGLLSLGLGFAQLYSPDEVARWVGARNDSRTRSTMLGIGLRELASGLGILLQRQPAAFVWGRVAGDLIDLALLARTFTTRRAEQDRTRTAILAVAGVTLLDAFSAVQLTSRRRQIRARTQPGFRVTKSLTINRPPEEVYGFWRQLENLPLFMAHLESVQVQNGTSHWKAKAPAGLTVEWDAEITIDRPNEAIGWRSLEGASVPNSGLVRFAPAPGDRGTEVRVELSYRPPLGAVGRAFAQLFGEEPSQQIAGDLRRLKQVLETGEVVHSDASIHRGLHAARPSKPNALERGLK